ncbi:MAG: hypothetical protein RIQ93_1618 [Verrucomicrobiota bacterium]
MNLNALPRLSVANLLDRGGRLTWCAAVAVALVAASSRSAAGERTSLDFQYVEDHRTDGGRSGEGSIAELADGRLLLMYSKFRDGAADHSAADIVQRYSKDQGRNWSAPQILFSRPANATNVMSASLLRLQDGRVGCVFFVKWTATTHCIPHWTASSDGGVTWTKPIPLTEEVGYFVGNNDRLIQMQDGVLVYPTSLHANTAAQFDGNGACGIFCSRDVGKTWAKAADANRFRKEWFTRPEPFRPERVSAAVVQRVENRSDVFQEPGVVELENGRLMMCARSNAHVYLSYLDRLDGKWEPFRAAAGINVCLGPQTIKRLPGSKRLVMLYNDRGALGYGEPGFSNRTPMSVAVSDDEGRSWKQHAPLEPSDTRNYCYSSLLFFKDQFMVSYYESADRTDLLDAKGKVALEFDGRPRRRNLASLKTCFGPASFFRD